MSKKKKHLPRHYYFTGPVDHDSVSKARNKVLRWAEHGGDITFDIRSFGGELETGLDLFGVLRFASERRDCRVTTVISGIAASMAGVLAQAGDHRTMRADSWLMVHEVSSGAWGTSTELRDHSEHLARLTGQVCDILTRRSDDITADTLLEMIRYRDVYFSAAEAMSLGLIDEII